MSSREHHRPDPEAPQPDLDLFGRAPTGHRDWAHRRREPRGLALLWTVYLMLATVVSLLPMVWAGQLSGSVYRPAARTMMVLVMFGVVVLWPVWRASQEPQHRAPILDVLRDAAVLVVPAFVLLWPQVLLTGWPIGVVSAASVLLVLWMIGAGSALLWWHRFAEGDWKGRAALAGVCVLVSGGLPLALLASGVLELGAPNERPSTAWMWSPLTAVWEVLRDRPWSGAPASVSRAHWAAILVQSLLTGAFAVVSAACCRGRAVG